MLVVDLSEVGRPLFVLLRESDRFLIYCSDVDEDKKHELDQSRLRGGVDVMHICIPCLTQDRFAEFVASYEERSKPRLGVIGSTVQLGTAIVLQKLCGECLVVHSMVRGLQEILMHMQQKLRRWTKCAGGAAFEASEIARKHLEDLGLTAEVLKSCSKTELIKLFETTRGAWMFACSQEMHRISEGTRAISDEVVCLLKNTHMTGEHHMIRNTELLPKSHDSEFLRLVLSFIEKRKREMKDKSITVEVDRIGERVRAWEIDRE